MSSLGMAREIPRKGLSSVFVHSEGHCLPFHPCVLGEKPWLGLGPALVPSVPSGLPGFGGSLGSPFLCLQAGTVTFLRDKNHL